MGLGLVASDTLFVRGFDGDFGFARQGLKSLCILRIVAEYCLCLQFC